MLLEMPIRTIVLNTGQNCTKTVLNSKNTIFTFDIPPIDIPKNAKLSVASFIHKDPSKATNKYVIVLKLKDIMYNNYYYYCNDLNNSPTILTFDTDYPSFCNGCYIYLNKQTISMISLLGTDSLTDMNSGIATTLEFCITLQIED